jgi:RNA polymerase sigma-70 factor (ECF subfamily)
MVEQSDEYALIKRSIDGDHEAFAQLMERYAGSVFNLAYRMLGNVQEAEDASQEIFLRAYTNLARFDQERRFSTWLLSIGSNYCIDRLRRRRFAWLTLDDVVLSVPTPAKGPERSAIEREERDAVQRALLSLPPTYREIAVLRYWNDLSYEEIIQVTGLPESTIKTRLHRARRMLAEALRAEGVVQEEIPLLTGVRRVLCIFIPPHDEHDDAFRQALARSGALEPREPTTDLVAGCAASPAAYAAASCCTTCCAATGAWSSRNCCSSSIAGHSRRCRRIQPDARR